MPNYFQRKTQEDLRVEGAGCFAGELRGALQAPSSRIVPVRVILLGIDFPIEESKPPWVEKGGSSAQVFDEVQHT